jgi:undecaprenyl-diphosphatase
MAAMSPPPATALEAAPRVARSPLTLHHAPPFRVTDFFRGRRPWLLAPAAVFAFLALSAAIAHGALLRTWDVPIQRFVEANRTETLTALVQTVSRFGSTIVVLGLAAALALLVSRRCRAVSVAIVVATAGRPLLEWTLKALVDRDRPDFDRLVPGNGPSFPSGHPMAAVALYGFLPVVVALYTHRRAIVYATWALTVTLVAGIAASRVYLGVHWFSDIIASIVLGAFLLIAIEWTVEQAHRGVGCGAGTPCAAEFDVEVDPVISRELDDDLAGLEREVDGAR